MALTRKQQKEEIRKLLWNSYAPDHAIGKAPNQTKKFFDNIPLNNFFSSTRRLLQLGVASGKYLSENEIVKKRKCIGYDCSTAAIELSKANGIEAKLIDLNSIDGNGDLTYNNQLEADLSEPTDILAIRIFEYLDAEAVILLVFALIDKAKPNSMFYIETYLVEKSSFMDMIGYKIKPGYIASFFAPRTDIRFHHHSVNRETPNNDKNLDTINRLIVQKL